MISYRKNNENRRQKNVQELRERLVKAYVLEAAHSRKAQAKPKEGYDLRATGAAIEKGDKVLCRKVAFDGKHKIADKWEYEPCIDLSQPNLEIPVFHV